MLTTITEMLKYVFEDVFRESNAISQGVYAAIAVICALAFTIGTHSMSENKNVAGNAFSIAVIASLFVSLMSAGMMASTGKVIYIYLQMSFLAIALFTLVFPCAHLMAKDLRKMSGKRVKTLEETEKEINELAAEFRKQPESEKDESECHPYGTFKQNYGTFNQHWGHFT
jgi:large-conductance mechanosensitive channel